MLRSDDGEDILEKKPMDLPTDFVECDGESRNENDDFEASTMRVVTAPQQKMMESIFPLRRLKRCIFLDIPLIT